MRQFSLNDEEIRHIEDLRKLTTAQNTMFFRLSSSLAAKAAPALVVVSKNVHILHQLVRVVA
jgi:hypothetical protein